MLAIACIFFGVVPMLIFATLIWRIDCWETEPVPLVIGAFIWGAVPSVILSLLASLILGLPFYLIGNSAQESFLGNFYMTGLVAPITEEIAKGIGVLIVFLTLKKQIHSILDGVIYGSVVGFGFSAVENTMYFLSETSWIELLKNFHLRAIYTGLSHSIFTGATGAGLAFGLFTNNRSNQFLWPLAGLCFAVFLHFTHNTLCVIMQFSESSLAGVLLFFINNNFVFWFLALIVYCLYREYCWISIQLEEEVRAEILTARQAHDAANLWHRSILSNMHFGFSKMVARKKLLKTATQLAYAKQHCQMRSSPFSSDKKIQELRQEVKIHSRKDPLLCTNREQNFLPPLPPLPPAPYMPPPLP